jgi:poly-gamma-glutamate capsule biosynthesis protein CapA/YwtB (metallophosphatase superfamily)
VDLIKIIAPVLMSLVITGCSVEESTQEPQTQEQITDAQLKLNKIAQTFSGTINVADESANVLANITINFANTEYTSDLQGQILFENITFGNHSVLVTDAAYLPYTTTITVTEDNISHTINLSTTTADQASLLFAGDTMFARRFLDPSLTTMTADIPDVEGALIRPTTASENAQALTHYVKDFFQATDFTSVNLETPITATPTTVHPTKEFSFFSLPETLDGIKSIGVDYVALGNNHVYDFLEDGLIDTLTEVTNAGIQHSGAGLNIADAYAASYINAGIVNLGLFSATSITGSEHEITYVTDDTKGGAADLSQTELVTDAINETILNSDYSIAQMHGGNEYTYEPSSYIEGRFELLAQQNVNLMVAHHPHVAQGFAVYNDVPAILGLGNFVFDQNRLETLLGVAVMLQINKDTLPATAKAFAYPLYVEDYQPRFINGYLSNYLVRRLAEFSDDNITLVPQQGYAELYFDANQMSVAETSQTVTIDATDSIIDLRQYAPSTSSFISKIEVINSADEIEITLGRDLMIFGDFEDWDNDDDKLEVTRWDVSDDSISGCISNTHGGQQALCSARTQFDNTPVTTTFNHTVRTMDVSDDESEEEVYKDFSLYGYVMGENAGKLESRIITTTAEDDLEFSTQYNTIKEAGDYNWQAFQNDFSLPSDELTLGDDNAPARGVKIAFRHYPPESDSANLILDDIALISWQKEITLEASLWQTSKMHGFDFMKIQNNEATTIRLTFSTFN